MIRTAFVVAALGGLLACGKGGSATASAAAEKVTLLDAGKEPRRPLRFRMETGDRGAGTIEMRLAMEGALEGSEVTPIAEIPSVAIQFATLVTAVDSDAASHVDMEVTEVKLGKSKDMPEFVTAMFRKALQGGVGSKFRWLFTNRGIAKKVDLTVPRTVDSSATRTLENMRDSLTQLSPVLPVESVGVGARWKVEKPIVEHGFSMQQVATYALRSIDGDSLAFDVSIRQSGKPQDLAPSERRPNARIQLVSLSTEGGGDMKSSLVKLGPNESHLSLETSFTMNMTENEMSQTILSKMRVELDLRLH